MKVLMLSRTLPPHGPGGLAAAAWDLARALARAGADIEVMTTAHGAPAETVAGLAVRALPVAAGRYSSAWWRRSAEAYAQAGAGAFDVVLGVSAAANALAARRWSRKPTFVFQAHGTSVGEIVSKLRSPRPRAVAGAARSLYWGVMRDRAYRDYDAVVAVGEAVRRQLAAWPTATLVGDTPVALIRNGVDPGAFRFDPLARGRLRSELSLADDAPLALFAGRLQADKGPLRAIEALRLARPQRPGLALVLVGDGPERPRLERRVNELGLQHCVRLVGSRPRAELVGWFSAADALLFPTRRAEGLPLVVLEALACGLPVLTTPQGAADPELPCDRIAADDLGGFAAALRRLSPRPVRPSRLPPAFHLDHSARAYLDLFERLLGSPTGGAA